MPNETFRQEKLTDYTVIRNAIFKDYTLSAKAVGVACKLLSLPPTWEYSVRGLVTLFSDGEASIRNALTELEEAGYLRREQVRADGKFSKCVYVISDELVLEKPCVENPHAVNPLAENPPQLNTKESNTKKLNTKQYTTEFENLWGRYPKKQGKEKAKASYIKARKDGATYEEILEGTEAYINYVRARGTDPQYIKMGSTFFNQRAWEDEWEISNGTNFRAGNSERNWIRGATGTGNQGLGAGRTKLPPSAPMSYEDSRSEDDA